MSLFTLDPTLAGDSIAVADLPLSAARLMKDATYPWLLLVPRRAGAKEIVDLSVEDRMQLMREIGVASDALRACVPCDKLNVAALGNQVAQLHVHVIARHRGDAAWPRPVWGQVPPAPYEAGAAEALADTLRRAMANGASS